MTRTWPGPGLPILVGVFRAGAVIEDAPIDSYVAALGRALSGPRRRKADLLAEALDGLVDATEAFEAAGLSRPDAEARAVEDFGELDEVVPSYRAELGLAQGRQTAVMLCLVMLAQPIIWKEGAWRWNQTVADEMHPFVNFLNELIVVVGSLSIAGAVLAVVAAGVGVRYEGIRTRATKATAVFALVSCALVCLLAIGLGMSGSPRSLPEDLGWVAGFVLAPLAVVGASAHRCLRLA